MRTQPIQSPNFGVRIQPTKVINHNPRVRVEKEVGFYKDHHITLTKNYLDNQLISRLIYVKDNTGKWLKSKLKYFQDGKWKVLMGGK